mgnify:CR=1 FL=1|tara:strand:+ start:3576 stop:4283 length:708 start_codon:yes stop_codon:yes gene_type:complete
MEDRNITVLPVLFRGRKMDGDFKFMVGRPEHANSVFIVAENYRDMLLSTEDSGGTAALRTKTWPISNAPRAVGIPTGWSHETGGFVSLLPIVKTLVDLSIKRILAHLIENPYVNKVIYSADSTDDSKIGVGIFKTTLSDDVRDYISSAIHDIPRRFARALKADPSFPTTEQLRQQEITTPVPVFIFAEVIHERARAARVAGDAQEKLKRLDKKPEPTIGKPGRIQPISHFVRKSS